jgi:molybdenum cofactor cytidylyltransferase
LYFKRFHLIEKYISMRDIWAIILAAGESKRMGFPKMLLSINGKSMLENVILNVIGSYIDHAIVVLGAGSELLTDITSKYSLKICLNDNYKEGMLSSVKCGFRNLPLDFEAVMIFQGDQPLITPKVINKVIEAYKNSDKGIVIPVHEKKRGHPLLINRKYIDKIDQLDNSVGLRSLAYTYPDDVLEIEINDPCILRDFDTYTDYLKVINQKL